RTAQCCEGLATRCANSSTPAGVSTSWRVKTHNVCPAPDTTAAWPALRNAAMCSRVSGMDGLRYCWCNQSSVAASNNSGSKVIAGANKAARDALATACSYGKVLGSNVRAAAVDNGFAGMATTGVIIVCGCIVTERKPWPVALVCHDEKVRPS